MEIRPVCPNTFEKIPIFALKHTYQLRGGVGAESFLALASLVKGL